jgi:hypothetical protein
MTKEFSKLGTIIEGIGSTPHIDSAGERVKLEGIDISTLTVNGLINTEHKSDNTTQIIGKIVEAKKIYKESDCENDRHKYFFKKAEGPYLYIKAILFDKFGHQGALDAVAMLKFDKEAGKLNEGHQVCGFSVEGSKLEVKGNVVEKCIARKMSFTNLPCNKMCIAEILENDSVTITQKEFSAIFKKAEDMEKYESLQKALPPKSPIKQKIIAQNKEKRLQSQDRYIQGIKQANTQATSLPTPKEKINQTSTTQPVISGAAWKAKIDAIRANKNKPPGEPEYKVKSSSPKLRKTVTEKMSLKKEMVNVTKQEAVSKLNKSEDKEKLMKFLVQKYPEMSKSEVLALACAYVAKKEKDLENSYRELMND